MADKTNTTAAATDAAALPADYVAPAPVTEPETPPPPPPPSAQVLKARETLATHYEAKGFKNEAGHIRDGAWDNEPFMTALVDIQP